MIIMILIITLILILVLVQVLVLIVLIVVDKNHSLSQPWVVLLLPEARGIHYNPGKSSTHLKNLDIPRRHSSEDRLVDCSWDLADPVRDFLC